MINLDSIWRRNPDMPTPGLAAGGAVVCGQTVLVRGVAQDSAVGVIAAPVLPGGGIGNWRSIGLPYAMTNAGVPVLESPNRVWLGWTSNLVTVPAAQRFRSVYLTSRGQSFDVQLGERGGSSSPALPAGANIVTAVFSPPLYQVTASPGGDLSTALEFQDPLTAGFTSVQVRHLLPWGDQLLSFGGYGVGAGPDNVPLLEVRSIPVGRREAAPSWKTYGYLPRAMGFSRSSALIWRNYLLVAGGNTTPAQITSAGDEIWAVRLGASTAGDWRLIGRLPLPLRSFQMCVDANQWLHIFSGVTDGSTDRQMGAYSARLSD